MGRTVSTSEAKSQLSALIESVAEGGEPAIIANHGRPRVAMISLPEYERLQALKDEDARMAAFEEMRAIAAEIGASNRDLSDEQAMELATRFSRELTERLKHRQIVALGARPQP